MSAQLLFIHSELDDYGLTPDEFRIVCRIARRGECTESAKGMADGCKIGERTVRLVLRTLATANIIEEEERSGQSTIRRIAGRAKWKSPKSLDSIRTEVMAKWNKKKPEAEPESTPATVAALASIASPATDAVPPCNDCSPTPATVAAKGNPTEVNPIKGEDAPEARTTSKGKKSEADPRTEHPAIRAMREIHPKGHNPSLEMYDRLIDVLGENPDVGKLRANRAAWIERGYNPNSYVWATEWYETGIPAKNGRASPSIPQNRRDEIMAELRQQMPNQPDAALVAVANKRLQTELANGHQ